MRVCKKDFHPFCFSSKELWVWAHGSPEMTIFSPLILLHLFITPSHLPLFTLVLFFISSLLHFTLLTRLSPSPGKSFLLHSNITDYNITKSSPPINKMSLTHLKTAQGSFCVQLTVMTKLEAKPL